jgi:hypothetical protein
VVNGELARSAIPDAAGMRHRHMEKEKIIPRVSQGCVGSVIEFHESADVFLAILPAA